MGNNVYGTRRPAILTANDIDIFYYYRPSRTSESADFTAFRKLDSSLLVGSESEGNISLDGMYDLKLPAEIFGENGIYTIYIKPKEMLSQIVAVSSLASDPTIRGIVIRGSGETFNNGNLVGYRIDYYDGNNEISEKTGEFKIITSNNRCEPVTQNFTDSMQSGVRYIFNDSSDLVFCTVTPSTAMSFKSSSLPNLGKTGDKIAIVNTKFNPICLEVEVAEHDLNTLSTMLEGRQIRNLDRGIITTFDENGGIYHQAVYGNITNPDEGINHDFKFPRKNNLVMEEQRNLKKIEDNI